MFPRAGHQRRFDMQDFASTSVQANPVESPISLCSSSACGGSESAEQLSYQLVPYLLVINRRIVRREHSPRQLPEHRCDLALELRTPASRV